MIERGGEIPHGFRILQPERHKEHPKTKDEDERGFHGVRKTIRKCNLTLAEDTQGREVKGLCLAWHKRTMNLSPAVSADSDSESVK